MLRVVIRMFEVEILAQYCNTNYRLIQNNLGNSNIGNHTRWGGTILTRVSPYKRSIAITYSWVCRNSIINAAPFGIIVLGRKFGLGLGRILLFDHFKFIKHRSGRIYQCKSYYKDHKYIFVIFIFIALYIFTSRIKSRIGFV